MKRIAIAALSGTTKPVFAAAAAYTTGSGGLGSVAGMLQGVLMALIVIGIAWSLLSALLAFRDEGSTTEVIVTVIRGGVVMGLGVIALALLS